jgi:membrane-bound lytic murein transglycosylase MltF
MVRFWVILMLIPTVLWAKPRSYAEIHKSKELNICYTLWLSKDTLAGYPSPYMEMAQAFAQKKNLTAKTKEILWGQQFENAQGKTLPGQAYTPALLESGQCDLYATNISPLEWRKKILDLNWIYISSLTVVVRKEDKKKFQSIEDLKSKTVYVVPNTTYHEWLLDYQKKLNESEKMKIVEVPQGGTIEQLLKKNADFIIFESQNALYSKTHISQNVAVAFTIGKAMESGWGFPKGSEELRDETVRFFEEEKKSPTSDVNQIYKKYFGMTLIEYEKLQHTLIQ